MTTKWLVAQWLFRWLHESSLDTYFPDFTVDMLEETLHDKQIIELSQIISKQKESTDV